MEVFGLGLKIKEEGAATVQAALNGLKRETNAVTSDMQRMGQVVQTTGNASSIAGDRAAKAAIGFAAVGQSIARTGSLTADAGTRIIEAGSQIASMFGAGGLITAAILTTGVAITTGMRKVRAEIEATKQKFDEFADVGNVSALRTQLNQLVQGRPSKNYQDGVIALATELAKLKDAYRGVIFGLDDLTAQSALSLRLNQDLTNAEKADLIRIGQLNDQIREKNALIARLNVLLPIAVNVEKQMNTEREKSVALNKEAKTQAAMGTGGSPAMTAGVATRITIPAPQFDLSLIQAAIPQAADIVLQGSNRVAQMLADQMLTTFRDSVGDALVGGIVGGIEQAVASGNISEGFKAFASLLLAGIGDAMIRFGLAAKVFSDFMQKIKDSLSLGSPRAALMFSLALIGVGAALKGAARGMFGGQSGGAAYSTASFGGGGFSGGMGSQGALPTTQLIFGQTSATTAAGMTPRQAMNVTIIGPNDPTAQRAIQELLNKANNRGSLG